MNNSINENIVWKFLERFGSQCITLIVSVLLARILSPSEYGTIAIVTAFTSFFTVLVTCGWGSSLIQKDNADCIDFSTMFYFSLCWGLILYMILFFLAPLIAAFYNSQQLIELIRVMGVLLPISSYNSIQQAYISRQMLFVHLFKATFLSSTISGMIGIILALFGYGVWSLVAQYMLSIIINTFCVYLFVRWKPNCVFSFKRLREMLPFGAKLLLEKVIQNCYIEVTSLLLGKFYTTQDLAYYNRAQQFPRLAVTNLSDSIGAVLFSAMSRMAGDKKELHKCLSKYLRYIMFLIIPILIGLIAISHNLILFLLSEKWIDCVPLLCVFCIYYLFEPIHALNSQVYKALGKGGIIVLLQFLRAAANIIALVITIKLSPLAIAVGATIVNVIYWGVVSWNNEKLIEYGFFRQLIDLSRIAVCGIIMGIITYFLSDLTSALFLNIFIQCLAGAVVYYLLCLALRVEEVKEIKNIITKKDGKK